MGCCAWITAGALSLACAGADAQTAPPAPTAPSPPARVAGPEPKPGQDRSERTRNAAAVASEQIASLGGGAEPGDVYEALDAEMDRLAADADVVKDARAFRTVSFAGRIARLVGSLPKDERSKALAQFGEHREFQAELAFALRPKDRTDRIAALALRFLETQGKSLDRFPGLAAAFCVVHDRAVFEQANENRAVADDPIKLFEYFIRNSDKMPLGLDRVPTQLLTFVVDTTAKVDELEWAIARYAGNLQVGRRFFDVQYDKEAFLKGAKKKVTEVGFSLPNLQKYGGVCIDQAYFAANVGKALGIPAVVMRARGQEGAHAWVAYLRWEDGSIWWDCTTGRYAEYRNLLGFVTDPHGGLPVPESTLRLRAAFGSVSAEDRLTAIALTDASQRLQRTLIGPGGVVSKAELSRPRVSVAPEQVQRLLDLTGAATGHAVACEDAWRVGVALAQAGVLTIEQRIRWADSAAAVLMENYPDFAVDLFSDEFATIEDTAQQEKLWRWLQGRVKGHTDLLAVARFGEAEMWEKSGNPTKAWERYAEVVGDFADAGPSSVLAAIKCVTLLKDAKRKPGDALALLKHAWELSPPPKGDNPGVWTQTNWFRIGRLYLGELQNAGRLAEADWVARKLRIKA